MAKQNKVDKIKNLTLELDGCDIDTAISLLGNVKKNNKNYDRLWIDIEYDTMFGDCEYSIFIKGIRSENKEERKLRLAKNRKDKSLAKE